jgi:hypothetical protein
MRVSTHSFGGADDGGHQEEEQGGVPAHDEG